MRPISVKIATIAENRLSFLVLTLSCTESAAEWFLTLPYSAYLVFGALTGKKVRRQLMSAMDTGMLRQDSE